MLVLHMPSFVAWRRTEAERRRFCCPTGWGQERDQRRPQRLDSRLTDRTSRRAQAFVCSKPAGRPEMWASPLRSDDHRN